MATNIICTMRALKITGIVLLIILLIPVIAITFFGGPIAKAVVKAMNNRLQTEIQVSKYNVAFWKSFPSVSVNLEDVQVAGSDGSTLLVAEEVSCLLDLGSLFGKVRVEEVEVAGGSLNLIIDVDGNSNYQLAGYTPVGEEVPVGEVTEFAIADAKFSSMEVAYRDAQLQVYLNGYIEDAIFSGDFGAEKYLLDTEAELLIYHLDHEGTRYINDTELALDAQTSVDNTKGKYTFAPLHLESGDLELGVIGELTTTKDGLLTDLRVESQSGSLEDVLALIPPAYAGTLNELETRGRLELSGSISGPWTSRTYPQNGRSAGLYGRTGG
ncbi:MAG: AsmA family protein [Bacteroidota bacterium]